MSHRWPLLILLCLPALAGGQDTAATSPAPGAIVWRLSANGDWLTAGPAKDGYSTPLVVAPLEPRVDLGPGDHGWGAVMGLSLGRQLTLAVSSDQQFLPTAARAGAAPWCDGVTGLLAVSGYANECLRSALGPDLQPRIQRDRAGVAWNAADVGVFVSYGVTRAGDGGWFAGLGTGPASGWSSAGAVDWSLPPTFAAVSESQDLTVGGAWRLSPQYAISLSAMVGEITLLPDAISGPGLFDQAGVRLGIARGSLSGGITGRVVRPSGVGVGPAGMWTGVDLGVSWRTPWDGELSFGAENLISRGSEALLPDPTLATPPAVDPATARSPYVRYKQDL